MKDLRYLNEKKMAILFWYDNKGEDEVTVCAGQISSNRDRLVVLLKENLQFEIFPEWIDRIKPVNQELKRTLLNADFCISLSVGDLPQDLLSSEFIKTGLKWPIN